MNSKISLINNVIGMEGDPPGPEPESGDCEEEPMFGEDGWECIEADYFGFSCEPFGESDPYEPECIDTYIQNN